LGSTPYTQSQQNMMNIMGGARPSENSKMVWQGMEGYLPINSQQPSIQSLFPINSYGVPNIGTSGIQNAGVGNMTSAFGTPGTWGGGYGGGYGGQGGGYGEGVAGGAGLTGSAFGGEGPGIAGGGLVGPAQGSPNAAANVVGAIAALATGNIQGAISAISKGAMGGKPSTIDSLIFDAMSFVSGNPNTQTQQAQFDAFNIAQANIDPSIQPDVMSGWNYGGDSVGGSVSGAGLQGSAFGGGNYGGDGAGIGPAK